MYVYISLFLTQIYPQRNTKEQSIYLTNTPVHTRLGVLLQEDTNNHSLQQMRFSWLSSEHASSNRKWKENANELLIMQQPFL